MSDVTSFGIKTPPQHGAWADYLDVWRATDDIDVFDSAWVFDHFYPLVGDTDGPCLESWTILAALAQATSRVRIGSMVNGMHYRHPAVTANMAVTVDHVSGGRLELGLGAGWNEQESTAYGIELGTVKERLDRLEEGVICIIGLLTQEHTDFRGEHYTLTNARCEPKPVQARIPIVIGGTGRKRTTRLAAQYADQWDGGFPQDVDSWAEINAVVDGHCADLGRDPAELARSIQLAWADGDDPAELADRAAAFAAAGVDQINFSMRAPYRTAGLEPLADALRAVS